ncbi:hypothetical protein EUGRSUZ_D01838 [Eucalyptus grandis]|uniref:Uncharacterized protein n=2 Tax=Eucalyptus grandis TaxID=71139 RepID=A0ACC3L6U3_EUCGR|nr:hypothetical protein EUGRSUZ_D01838 [Eucalyptus grandis]
MWIFGWRGPSGFSARSTAEEVTQGIDGTGLTAIVTGASSGIGMETARVLALRGVHVVMAVRNVDAGRSVKEAILKERPSAKIDVMELDLISMASVWKFASDYQSSALPLNLLMGNGMSLHTFSRQHRATVCNKPYRYSSIQAYGQSKLANILHANELARRLKEEGVQITANSLHPGAITTNLLRHHSILNVLASSLGRLFLKNVQQGAATTCYVALHSQVKGVSGEYFMDSNKAKASSLAQDAELAKKLWDFSISLLRPK